MFATHTHAETMVNASIWEAQTSNAHANQVSTVPCANRRLTSVLTTHAKTVEDVYHTQLVTTAFAQTMLLMIHVPLVNKLLNKQNFEK